MANMSNFPNGFEHGVTIRGVPILNSYCGTVYYVDSVNGSDAHDGTYIWPKASINYLIANDVVRAGDIIIAKPGHIETVAAALTWDIAGIAIVFAGEGASRAYLNLTATGSYVSITGASVTMVNPVFKTAVNSVAKGLQVAAADFTMVGAEYYDAASKNSLIQVLTTSAADRMRIFGYRFFAGAGGAQKTDGIKTVGAIAGLVLHDINIIGDFSTSPVNISQAATNVELEHLNLNNTNSGPQPAMTLHANTEGFAEDVKLRVASGTTYTSSVAKINWGIGCHGYNSDGSGGASIGTATDISGAVDSVGVQVSTADSSARSVGIQASTIASKVDSAGIQVSSAQSLTGSVGVQTSTAASLTGSVGVQASTLTSKTDSAGIQVSTVGSKTDSTGIQVSTVDSRASVTVSQVGSVGVQTSTVGSKTDSAGIQVSTVQSKTDSVGVMASNVISMLLSVATVISTINSKT